MSGNATNRELTRLPCFVTALERCTKGGYEQSGSFNRQEEVLLA